MNFLIFLVTADEMGKACHFAMLPVVDLANLAGGRGALFARGINAPGPFQLPTLQLFKQEE